jgi:hypothetical protein
MPRAIGSPRVFAVAAEVTRLIVPRESAMIREPPYVGCYFFNGLLRRVLVSTPIQEFAAVVFFQPHDE